VPPTQLVLTIDVLQSLVIGNKDKLLMYQIVTLMLQRLDDGIELQVVSGIILL
jgi:hypothetical protein